MALSSDLCHRQSDRSAGKSDPKDFPKNHGGELTGGFLIVVLVCLFSGGVPLLVLHYLYRYSAGGRICAGGILVLSASCYPFTER